MSTYLELREFLKASENELIIDVRTPAEFEQGHIVGATNIPLFTNDDRVQVGTYYKQKGRQAAILLGFELIGGRWANYIREVEAITHSKKVFVHCWRGGMRSAAMAWALTLYGFDVYLLKDGYKIYRNYCLEILQREYPIVILSGKTGSAKTEILHSMKQIGEQVIDLEQLVNHQGSSFGSRGNEYQPSQELFENRLAHELNKMDVSKRIWIENESIVIGKRVMPPILFKQMRATEIIDLQIGIANRVEFLNSVYGILPKKFLTESVLKISKRLGPNETKLTLQDINEDRMTDFIKRVLVYYDKYYTIALTKRLPSKIHALSIDAINPIENAKVIIKFCNQLFGNNVEQFKTLEE
jgi:tRNA 2-selenouridine synthase